MIFNWIAVYIMNKINIYFFFWNNKLFCWNNKTLKSLESLLKVFQLGSLYIYAAICNKIDRVEWEKKIIRI